MAGNVVREPCLIGHELLPANITRMGIAQADRPLLDGDLDRRALCRSRPASGRVLSTPAIDISTGVDGIVQDLQDPRVARRDPDHRMRRRSVQRANRQRQAVPLQLAHHRLGALQRTEAVEHQPQPRLYLLIRVERNVAAALLNEARRQWQAQFAAGRLLSLPLMQPHADLVQFRLAHDARQAEEQAVMVDAG
jgi:hypothetical protein